MSNVKTGIFGDGHNVNQALLAALEHADDAKAVVIAMIDKDDLIRVGFSTGCLVRHLGLCELATDSIKDHLYAYVPVDDK